MNELLCYLNALTPPEQRAFAARIGTTVNYLRKAISIGQRLGESLAIAIERESGGAVPVSVTRPDFAEVLEGAGYAKAESRP